jgi:N-acetylglucosaminyldiphosphoundecaprenol N-acetyl-beta-D-mannosaminyltransferase
MPDRAAETLSLFGLPISNVTVAGAVAEIERFVLSGRSHQVATANLDFARNALNNTVLQRIICDCSLVVADGTPFLWASRLVGKPLAERVTGVDLIPGLAQLSAERGYSIFFLGSSDNNSRGAENILRRTYPNMNVVGRYSPPLRQLDEMDDDEILRRIDRARPDILLVAFGNPKQEIWIHRNLKRMGVPVAIGIGGSLDIISGRLRRAPFWMRASGLEWAFRCAQEPARLFPRYVKDAASLLRHLPLELLANAVQPRGYSCGEISTYFRDNTCILGTPASLDGDSCQELIKKIETAIGAGISPIVDLSATRHLGAQGLGALLEVRRVIRVYGKPVLFTGMDRSIQRVCRLASIQDMIPTVSVPPEVIGVDDWNQGWPPPLPQSFRKTPQMDTIAS